VPGRQQPPTLRLRRLAAELRRLREASGLTRDEIAESTDINPATLYRLENAKARPQVRTLRTLLGVYGVENDRTTELLEMLRAADQRGGWLQTYQSELPETYTTYIEFEDEAQTNLNYESLFIPGLLQTEAYARALIRGTLPLATAEEVESRVSARIHRQERLTSGDLLRLWAIVDEAAFRRQVGGVDVMREQLKRLQELAELPNLTFQVIPLGAGAHPGMLGSFAILKFVEDTKPDVIYIESGAGDLFLDDEPSVNRYNLTFEHLRAAALSPTASNTFAAEVAEAH
jgi:transcriptional regulator with XRE-family HTH domain